MRNQHRSLKLLQSFFGRHFPIMQLFADHTPNLQNGMLPQTTRQTAIMTLTYFSQIKQKGIKHVLPSAIMIKAQARQLWGNRYSMGLRYMSANVYIRRYTGMHSWEDGRGAIWDNNVTSFCSRWKCCPENLLQIAVLYSPNSPGLCVSG